MACFGSDGALVPCSGWSGASSSCAGSATDRRDAAEKLSFARGKEKAQAPEGGHWGGPEQDPWIAVPFVAALRATSALTP